jgi:hypothetical protein
VVTIREQWSANARRVGIASASGIAVVGALYLAVIGSWLVIEATPGEPIGDPYLAGMELLTIVSAVAVLGFSIAVSLFVDTHRRVFGLAVAALGSLAAGATIAVHFVQLTAVRQLWRSGNLADYRLVWPSILFAVEYSAWDVLLGLTMVAASFALAGEPRAAWPRRAFLLGGILCLVGIAGPLSGRMVLQNIAVFGYAVVLPVASLLTARLFKSVRPSGAAA